MCEGAGMRRLASIFLESEIVLLGVILFNLVLWYQFSKLNSRALLHENCCEEILHIYGRQACAQTCCNASVLKSSLQIRVGMCLQCVQFVSSSEAGEESFRQGRRCGRMCLVFVQFVSSSGIAEQPSDKGGYVSRVCLVCVQFVSSSETGEGSFRQGRRCVQDVSSLCLVCVQL